MKVLTQFGAILLSLVLATSEGMAQASPNVPAPAAPTAQDLQQLVAPIALYPDELLAQVLAASTYPTQVVEAERWVQQNSSLKGQKLGAEVDKKPWDASIKGLTQFPSVLSQMSQNLSWTSALGDAYFNDPQGVTAAIQALRKRAQNAGTLKNTPEQTVTTQGQTIVIQPAQPEVVYVPTYSPAVVYGTPIAAYPGYSGWDVAGASLLSFGIGTAVGAAVGGWGWGWGHWGYNWGGGSATFNRNTYVSRSNTFVNRNSAYVNRNSAYANRNSVYNGANRANYANRNYANGNLAARPNANANNFANNANRSNLQKPAAQNFNRQGLDSRTSRGYGQQGLGSRGTSSGAFSGYRQGGAARMDGARGRSSFGGGRGGGGFGGGGRGGGGRRGGGGGRR